MAIKTTHKLLTDAWTDDVHNVEEAIRRFGEGRTLRNHCEVVLFEIDRDDHLHVNVTHEYATKPVVGWIGPAILPGGFVHNRIFADTRPKDIIRHIRQMVFATRN
jgi:hypothetical protein